MPHHGEKREQFESQKNMINLLMSAEWVLTGTMPWIRREFLPDRTRNAAPQTTKGFIGHPASRRSESETKKIAAV
jgi:hypothetical protein